ncbi:BZ3500_MvSof-1268-A1-R1_Chr7-1g09419 [Microbotryum saponariae]|uniref:BZ3500_MvSof-1268-A1-R1_Chr7-1g09419 protein n=1 Tax=Microbotryum saponariae TaxID=289078 RepID=A0A2X0KYB4_9BASI|nr:BZ3501_MvSof-1269-A2-R1_Chr7-1g09124 [Microbotryum saponariae]SDA03404.1 BZ3500_MvSof-1268-A1-R1_Chr7-1g09419 [Microbotryum saponariae]
MVPSLAMLRNKPSLKLTLEQEMLFVRPPTCPSAPPSDDPFLRGTVLLSLPKPRLCKRLRVVIEGLADAFGGLGFPYESTTTLRKEVVLDLKENGMLEAGDHLMRFEMLVPSSTAVFQRCSHGRVRHSVRAFLDFPTPIPTSISTPPTAFWISATLKDPGEPPDPLDAFLSHFNEHLGPVVLRIASPHLTISSLIHTHVEFLAPPLSCTVVAIASFMAQTFEVTYKDGQRACPPTRRHFLPKVDPTRAHATPLIPTPSRPVPISTTGPAGYSPLAPVDPIREDPVPLHILEQEHPWTYEMVARVPRDEIIRPTTLEGTLTPIKVKHRFILEIRYRVEGEDEDRLLTVGRNCCIASCCCLSDSALPPYAASAADAAPVLQPTRNRCLCNVSLEQMFDSEGLPLQRVGTLSIRRPSLREIDEDDHARSCTIAEYGILERSDRDTKSAPAHLGIMEGRA